MGFDIGKGAPMSSIIYGDKRDKAREAQKSEKCPHTVLGQRVREGMYCKTCGENMPKYMGPPYKYAKEIEDIKIMKTEMCQIFDKAIGALRSGGLEGE